VEGGEFVTAGEQLTEGSLNPHEVLAILGPEVCQLYLVDEVQRVYRSQGVNINDRHIEVIVRQMMRRVEITAAGDTDWLEGERVERNEFERVVAQLVGGGPHAAGGQAGAARRHQGLAGDGLVPGRGLLPGDHAVLTEAAIAGRTDHLVGLKENVIIGKLIPARARSRSSGPSRSPRSRCRSRSCSRSSSTSSGRRRHRRTPSVFAPTEEMKAELAGATSFVAEPT
jgi:DNA-directed RNA polymerase subunit beta'